VRGIFALFIREIPLTFDRRRFAVHHFDEVAGPLAESGRYDAVCFGHNHQRRLERTGETGTGIPEAREIRNGVASRISD
jgi:hypothetical protein